MAPVEQGWYPGHRGTTPMLRPWEGPPGRVLPVGSGVQGSELPLGGHRSRKQASAAPASELEGPTCSGRRPGSGKGHCGLCSLEERSQVVGT